MYLEICGIGQSFGDKEVLKNLSFKIRSGRAMGFLGRNGSGKTTTLRCIMNIFKPKYGETLDGQAFNPKKNRVGYLPEEGDCTTKKDFGSADLFRTTQRLLEMRAEIHQSFNR